MFRYADPDACPGCRQPIDRTSPTCVECGLLLTGPLPSQVFQALARADQLVADLYALPVPSQVTAALSTGEERHRATAGASPRPAMSAASVPKILLGLGALCLLVASLVFLAVAWAALGVAGRTAVLMLLTLVAGALMSWVARRGLRAGAEAFAAVGLGLLALDLGGAREAGWFGSIDDAWFLLVSGLVVALSAGAAARWGAGTAVRRLVSAEVFAVVGVGVAALGASQVFSGEPAGQVLLAMLVSVMAAVAAGRATLRAVARGCWALAGLSWVLLLAVAVPGLFPPTVEHVWSEFAVWPTLVAAGLAGAVAIPRKLPIEARVGCAAVACVLGVLALTAVSFDESGTTVSLVQLAVIAGGGILVAVLPRPWGWAASAPSVIAAIALASSVARLAVVAVDTLAPADVWVKDLGDRLVGPEMAWSWPILLPAGVVGISVCAISLLWCAARPIRPVVVPTAAALVIAAALLPGLYDAALAAAVLALVAVTAALSVAAVRTDSRTLWISGAVAGSLALLAGLANDVATAIVLVVLVAGALAAERTADDVVRISGRVVAPLAAGGLLWTAGHLAGLPIQWQALPVLGVLGAVIVLRPAWERELAAGFAITIAVAGSGTSGLQLDQTWLAVYLTVAGVVCTASSLVNADRRRLAWLGLALFTAAQWVRLDQLGVETVEAYTLPLALVLLAVGGVALRRGADSSFRTLGAGLALALVPTLLQVLVEPVGVRAVLLGLGCLVLVAVGVAMRLGAPLVAGAAVGAVVVLREGTLAQVLPQWALIGLVGVTLTVVGITWEQRLQELRRVSAYVQGLR